MTLSDILKQRGIKFPLAIAFPTSLLVAGKSRPLHFLLALPESFSSRDTTHSLQLSPHQESFPWPPYVKSPRASHPQYSLSSSFIFHSTHHLILYLLAVCISALGYKLPGSKSVPLYFCRLSWCLAHGNPTYLLSIWMLHLILKPKAREKRRQNKKREKAI